MFSNDLDPNWVLRDYQTRLDHAEYERLTMRVVSSQPGRFARLAMALANLLIAAGTRLRDAACQEPCEPVGEPLRL